ncbi:MAG: hypothetical protein WCI02_09280 [Planctomycetota bacterium]
MASKPKKSTKKHKVTRAEVLASIDSMADEIISDVRAIAEQQKYLVEFGPDIDASYQISELLGNAVPTLQMLGWKIRNRGEVAS